MCTLMTINSKKGEVFTGRTNEFNTYYESSFNFFPRDYKMDAFAFVGNNNSWSNKYSFIGQNATGIIKNENMVADGLNEKGLAGSLLYFHYHTYKVKAKNEIKPDDFEATMLLAYILANFATVQEVRDNIKKMEEQMYFPEGLSQAPFGLHLSITDATGESIVIEPEREQLILKENPLRILTNSSPLEFHYEWLRKYSHLSSFEQKPNLYKNLENHKLLTNGNGLFGIPGDFTADSRFVRAAMFTSLVETPEDDQEAVTYLFRMLHTADIVPGFVTEKFSVEGLNKVKSTFPSTLLSRNYENSTTEHTDNILVKDLTNLKYYYKTYDNISPRFIDLSKIKDKTEKMTISLYNDNSMTYQEVTF